MVRLLANPRCRRQHAARCCRSLSWKSAVARLRRERDSARSHTHGWRFGPSRPPRILIRHLSRAPDRSASVRRPRSLTPRCMAARSSGPHRSAVARPRKRIPRSQGQRKLRAAHTASHRAHGCRGCRVGRSAPAPCALGRGQDQASGYPNQTFVTGALKLPYVGVSGVLRAQNSGSVNRQTQCEGVLSVPVTKQMRIKWRRNRGSRIRAELDRALMAAKYRSA